MNRVPPHLRRVLLGSAFLMFAVVTAPALGEPASLKLGAVKGESSDPKHGQGIQILSFSWGELSQGKNIRKPPNRASSDPEEGGEVVGNVEGMKSGDTSDPEEGGEIVRNAVGMLAVESAGPAEAAGTSVREPGKLEVPNLSTARKVTVSDMTVVKRMDKASAQLAEPLPSGSATLVVARGSVSKGQHFAKAQITMRSRTYELQDAEVTACTALADGTDSCTLTYQSLGQ